MHLTAEALRREENRKHRVTLISFACIFAPWRLRGSNKYLSNVKHHTMKFLFIALIFFTIITAADSQPISKEFKIKKGQTYLNLPVSNSARLIKARIKSGDKVLDQFTINLAEANPDFWTFF